MLTANPTAPSRVSGHGEDSQSASHRGGFNHRLESLRGVAALNVAAFHTWQAKWIDARTGETRSLSAPIDGETLHNFGAAGLSVIGNGYNAVLLFFVLSGFLLSGSLARGPTDLKFGLLRFLIARVMRIYPAVFATIAVFAIVYLVSGAFINSPDVYAPASLFRNALLIDTSIDGVMWTLQFELLAIPLIVIAYVGWRSWGLVFPTLFFVVLAIATFPSRLNVPIHDYFLFMTIFAFMPRILAYYAGPKLLARVTPHAAAVLFSCAVAGFLCCHFFIGPWRYISFAQMSCAAVAVAILTFSHPGPVAKLLDFGLVRFFGRVSYSFYLLHPLTLMIIWKMPDQLGSVIAAGVPSFVLSTILFVASVAVVVPMAIIMHRCVETPGVAAGRRMVSALRTDRSRADGTAASHIEGLAVPV